MAKKNTVDLDLSVLGIVVAILVVLVTLAYFIYRRRGSLHRNVLVAGLSDSGKTLLFSMLIHDKPVSTQTSIQENSALYTCDKGSVNVVDIPGYERLREVYLEQYKKTSRALIYMVDAVTFTKDLRDVAEYLFVIMSDPTFISNCRNILIFCNKLDCPTAKGMEVIKNQLEKELNLLRNTKANQLLSTDGKDKFHGFLGSKDSDFSFSQYQAKVEFAEGYVYNGDSDPSSDISAIEDWLEKLC